LFYSFLGNLRNKSHLWYYFNSEYSYNYLKKKNMGSGFCVTSGLKIISVITPEPLKGNHYRRSSACI